MNLASAPILVTGASGFLGEHLVRVLAARGADVVGTYLNHPIDIAGARTVPVDLADGPAVERLIRDLRPGAVFHCAALTDAAACERDPAAAEAAIVDATARLAGALGRLAPGTPMVAVSTDLVFDGEGAPYAEEDEAKPLGVYGSLKLRAERPVLDLPLGSVVRTALLFGPPGTCKGGFLAWMIGAILRDERLTLFEDEVRTPVHVRDVVDAMLALAMGGRRGLFHAGGPERLSRMEMGRILCRVAGRDEKALVSVRLAESKYPAPRPRDVSLVSEKLREATGFAPRTFEQGLREILGTP